MLYTIENQYLSVTISDLGAQLQSLRHTDGTEYLWQGDPDYWSERAPVLFPYIGRMINGQYHYKGKLYSMKIHGFASASLFAVTMQTDTSITFCLQSNQETLQQYPWEHRFSVTYELHENQLAVTYNVQNLDKESMRFAVGGHPGFLVPLEKGLKFEDYRIRFTAPCEPEKILLSEDCFILPQSEPFSLADRTYIPLTHDLFCSDAIILKNTSKCVVLEAEGSKRSVAVSFPDMPYIGFWQMPNTDAPFICIEPWSSLPSQKKSETTLEEQKDLLVLESGKNYTNTWSIEII